MLASLVGRRVARLVHYAEEPLEDLSRDESYVARGVGRPQYFANVGGPVLVTLDDDREICVSYSEELVSVTLRLADSAQLTREWGEPIDAEDPAYSERCFADLVGKTIKQVTVVQLDLPRSDKPFVVAKKSGGRSVWLPKVLARPREVALVLAFEDGGQLVFSTAVTDAPNNFSVTPELLVSELPTAEILRIPERGP